MTITARVLAKDVVTASPEETVAAVAQRMAGSKVGSIALLDSSRKLAGIFTERDLLSKVVGKGLDPAKTKVLSVMTSNPATVQADEPLEKVFAAFSEAAYRHLPIMEGDRLIGIASLHDFAQVLVRLGQDEQAMETFAEGALSSPRQVIRVRGQ
ncbi:MAG: CBS domain-containing protein [Elusimicrobia bacterium]|nr:CBS domain-containing protein [Elusimicrobiota bacterium]